MEKSTSEETYLRGKILVGDMFFKLWESLLYFHEKHMLKQGRIFEKRSCPFSSW